MLLRADLNPIEQKDLYIKLLLIFTTQISQNHKSVCIAVLTTQCQRKIQGKIFHARRRKRVFAKDIYSLPFTTTFHNSVTEFMSLDRTQIHQPSPRLQSWNMLTKKNLSNIPQRTHTLPLALGNIQVSPSQAENLCHSMCYHPCPKGISFQILSPLYL